MQKDAYTISDLSKKCITILKPVYDDAEAVSITRILLEEATGLSSIELKLNNNRFLTREELLFLEESLARLKNNEPLQYILGHTWFYGYKFNVRPGVLIPRRETEELVDWILNTTGNNKEILDIGTGSGCIAVSLKKNKPESEVSAWDISTEALEIAKQNAQALDVVVNFSLQDVFSIKGTNRNFDIIVSNPPYVLESEKVKIHNNVLKHEPAKALFVSDQDSLVFYRKIAEIAFDSLNNGGLLFFEINEQKGEEMKELLRSMGFVDVVLKNDLQGKPRMIRAAKG